MIRYKSPQDITQKARQNRLSPMNNQNLKARTKRILETENKKDLKRKLIVYKKEDKFYIDNASAYALNVIKTRAIMTGLPNLFEISTEVLDKLQRDETLEIEYTDFNKEFTIDKSGKIEKIDDLYQGELTRELENLEQGIYGIGIHEIISGNADEKQSIASSILSEGLNLNNASQTILSTAISEGTNEDVQKLAKAISGYQYSFGDGTKMNIVIAAPLWIQNQAGEKIFLGFPEKNSGRSAQQYEEHCILDQICHNLRKIPPEFILGCYYETPDHNSTFIPNERHYSNISQEDREHLFQEISANMSDKSRTFNELINTGNIEQLTDKGNFAVYIDNAISLYQKYQDYARLQNKTSRRIILDNTNLEQTSTVLEKSRRRGILESQHPNETPQISTPREKKIRTVFIDGEAERDETVATQVPNKSKRLLLKSAYSETKLSDLSTAKSALREGIEEPEKNDKGKEV